MIMDVSKYLHFTTVNVDAGQQVIIDLKPEEGRSIPRATREIVNGNLAEVNFLLASCEIIESFKKDNELDFEKNLQEFREWEEFQNLFLLMERKYGPFGFKKLDLEILALTQLKYQQRKRMSPPHSPTEQSLTPAGDSKQPTIIPTRPAPPPPARAATTTLTGVTPTEGVAGRTAAAAAAAAAAVAAARATAATVVPTEKAMAMVAATVGLSDEKGGARPKERLTKKPQFTVERLTNVGHHVEMGAASLQDHGGLSTDDKGRLIFKIELGDYSKWTTKRQLDNCFQIRRCSG